MSRYAIIKFKFRVLHKLNINLSTFQKKLFSLYYYFFIIDKKNTLNNKRCVIFQNILYILY